MESSSNHKACLLKIESPTKSVEKLLKTIEGVNFTIDKRSKTVYICGKIDPQIILEKITKAGKKAEIIWTDDGRQKPPESQKDHLMQQRYPPGHMNGPNGFSNYHPQQCYYPPPNWMNHQLQPYYPQGFGLPPPYVRQFHPQPPPPLPYEYHPKEPAAKSFPPTPAPPKNFTMGDLQPGCNIM
ncbi:hypothetical protein AALP_AA5G262400 [Arabis alpina]|uniref:HMA domain-containing protein n=1 Tax=Arabis alpina TaxID=50452 RepID=A0A087GZG0_ARAAL|nr:hypothetical protein AALP_AA5G262400 [Arabis alpina]